MENIEQLEVMLMQKNLEELGIKSCNLIEEIYLPLWKKLPSSLDYPNRDYNKARTDKDDLCTYVCRIMYEKEVARLENARS